MASGQQSLLPCPFPIGSIYMNINSTSPSTFWPGTTWEQLKDRFLLGAGNTYSAGGTGGAASVSYKPAGTNSGGAVSNHTLTVDQIPAHNHSFTGSAVTSGGISANHTHTGSSGNPSANHTHSGPSHHHVVDQYVQSTNNLGYARSWARYTGTTSWSGSEAGYVVFASKATSGRTSDLYVKGDTSNSGTGATGTVSAWHTHSITIGNQSAGHTHSVTASGSIGNKGGGKAHNHGFTQPTFTGTAATIATMPPYLTVYIWKRTT